MAGQNDAQVHASDPDVTDLAVAAAAAVDNYLTGDLVGVQDLAYAPAETGSAVGAAAVVDDCLTTGLAAVQAASDPDETD